MATDSVATVAHDPGDSWATDDFEYELERVREEIYEETKDMTPEEWQAYITKETEPIIRQYGLRTISVDEVRARGGFPPLGDG
ncbi:MAG: hypothetical protein LBR38_07930 [Synergistaceae bacterium]|jgi:hypothetical protein|nr:hypothetical protein [Synergistaceae bacterium]